MLTRILFLPTSLQRSLRLSHSFSTIFLKFCLNVKIFISDLKFLSTLPCCLLKQRYQLSSALGDLFYFESAKVIYIFTVGQTLVFVQ